MPRVTEEHRRAQRERITEAALRVAARAGLGAMSMGDVIKESGLSAGAIYGYFTGRDELVAAVAAQLIEERLDAIEAVARERPLRNPAALVEHLVSTMPAAVTDRGLVLEVWGAAARDAQLNDLARAQVGRFTRAMGRYLVAYLEEQGHPDAESLGMTLAPALTALAQGFLVRVAVEGDEGGRAYREALVALSALVPGRGID